MNIIKKGSFVLVLLLGWSLPLLSQTKPEISFEQKEHDFGLIKEENGSVTHQFYFTNTGKSPLVIQNVRASCGCTTPGWTREPVPPGEQGFVKALYNPRNRPGAFNKTLTVSSNGEPEVVVLHIKGIVKPKPTTPEDEFPTAMGALRVKYGAFHLGRITNNAIHTKTFEIYNQSDQPLSLSEVYQAPDFIKIAFEPQILKSNERGKVLVTYDTPKKNDLGYVSDNILIKTNELEDSIKNFRVIAMIEEYFPPMTPEELERAPRIELEESSHDFGSIKQGEEVTTEFVLTNKGKEDLVIRKTKANCGCTVSNPAKHILKPGESTNLSVKFNSAGRLGNQQKSVTIFSNDPREPMKMITIKAKVLQSS
ncbi:MAG: DUF1573 domain-containing protein [Candidatus Cyclobacteriaceae bacterium M3_2C_046]